MDAIKGAYQLRARKVGAVDSSRQPWTAAGTPERSMPSAVVVCSPDKPARALSTMTTSRPFANSWSICRQRKRSAGRGLARRIGYPACRQPAGVRAQLARAGGSPRRPRRTACCPGPGARRGRACWCCYCRNGGSCSGCRLREGGRAGEQAGGSLTGAAGPLWRPQPRLYCCGRPQGPALSWNGAVNCGRQRSNAAAVRPCRCRGQRVAHQFAPTLRDPGT